MFKAMQSKDLVNFELWKMLTVNKTQKSFNANIFVLYSFKKYIYKKQWNSIFTIIYSSRQKYLGPAGPTDSSK
jgi:hypothetical protein